MLGFRTLCDNYDEVLKLSNLEKFHIANLSKGKANDDGYRGVHIYFQVDNFHYPIEIQLVTISRPSAYGEYEPYHFVNTEQEFERVVKNMY